MSMHDDGGLASLLPGMRRVAYERRLIIFFDILGWKEHIRRAGSDTARITELNFILNMFSVFERHRGEEALPGAQISTFSDNIAVSVPYSPEFLESMINAMARVQLGLALAGFLVRGAISIGELVHTRSAVFGPALIRAYELESRRAVYPRVLLDPDCEELQGLEGPLLRLEAGLPFIDPFEPALLEELVQSGGASHAALAALADAVNVPEIVIPPMQIPGEIALRMVAMRIAQELQRPMRERDWQKLEWLFNRIAVRMQLPVRASHLPRTVVPEP
jgi:hypothetical protein